ncbi:ArsR/SmtB family transcription factor [Caldicellulosiruptor sp. F32]|uniref:ArsR/SmtB family transcription factor n=1 Tax=Caldicellulosiruptor sp. F32 TaxID=1214564 RepID=UPI0003A4A00F|nr:winged helix-turn-helix transcriptional regulator [Caldicellulosiruptor sp. F32]
MKQIDNLKEAKILFEALASDARLEIINLLSKHREMNMNEIAQKLGLTNGAVTQHMKKLIAAGIVTISAASGKHGNQKICRLVEDKIIINIVTKHPQKLYECEIKVGNYSIFEVYPTCGLATKDKIIGEFDDPKYFAHPEHVNCDIIWFMKGYVEYMIPNFLKPNQIVTEIQISFEISSEAPGVRENWPSDIYFYINGVELGFWTCPGDFGETRRGIFTPSWWPTGVNQYGLLKVLTISKDGTYIDGSKISNITLKDIDIESKNEIRFRVAVPDHAKNIGGVTLFGRHFGNYDQDIKFRIFYEEV